MDLVKRWAKEKTHLFWTFPIINVLLNLVNSGGIIFLVFQQGRWEGLLAIPIVFSAWVFLWFAGRKFLYSAEVGYAWSQVEAWNEHQEELEKVRNQLDRIETELKNQKLERKEE